MDNVTHTLIGASLAATGLRRRSRYAAAAMMIGANIPDVDVIAVPLGHSVEWRRGVTHGVPALVLWPFVLTGLVMLWHRWRHRPGAGASEAAGRGPVPFRPGQLLLLSTLAVWTHPTYDWMNNYGLRWLMPFDGTWFYGDSLFIVDPWLLLVLVIGAWMARRRRSDGDCDHVRPARIAVAVGAGYTLLMVGLHGVAERTAHRMLVGDGQASPRLMAAPTPFDPRRWQIVVDRGTHYERGVLRLGSPTALERQSPVAVGLEDSRARRAAADPSVAGFLHWARWPVYRVDAATGAVRIADIRYASPDAPSGWATRTVMPDRR